MPDKPGSVRIAILAIGIVLVVVSVACAALVTDPIARWSGVAISSWLIVWIAIAYSSATYSQRVARFATDYGPLTTEIDWTLVNALADEHGLQRINFSHVISFAQAILWPDRIFTRISESVVPYHRSIAVRTTLTASLTWFFKPDAPVESENGSLGASTQYDVESTDTDLVLPLVLTPRNQLVNGLRVFDGSGHRTSTVAYDDAAVYALAVLRSMLHYAGGTALKDYVSKVEKRFAELLESGIGEADVAPLLELVRELECDAGRGHLAESAAELMEALVRLTPICVTVPIEEVAASRWPSSFRFRVESRVLQEIRDAPNVRLPHWWWRFLDWSRLAVGVRINRIYVPLTNAARAASYHLEVEGPEGTYLAYQELLPDSEITPAPLIVEGLIQHRRAQRRAHLYLRSITNGDGAVFATQFNERSPGSFAGATLSAVTATIVVVVLMWRDSAGGATGNLSLLPALLAVPIGVSALMGLDSFQKFRHPSLLSRFLTFSTVAVCLGAFALTTLRTAAGADLAHAWIVLSALSASITLVAFTTWVLRFTVEHHLSMRGDVDILSGTREG